MKTRDMLIMLCALWMAGSSEVHARPIRCAILTTGCDRSSLVELGRLAEASCPCTLAPDDAAACTARVVEAYEPRLPRRCRREAIRALATASCVGGSYVLCETGGDVGGRRLNATPRESCLGRPLDAPNAVVACAEAPVAPGPPTTAPVTGGPPLDVVTYLSSLLYAGGGSTHTTYGTVVIGWSYLPGGGTKVDTFLEPTEIALRTPPRISLEERVPALRLGSVSLLSPDPGGAPPLAGMLVCTANVGSQAGIGAASEGAERIGSALRDALVAETTGRPPSIGGLPAMLRNVAGRMAPAGGSVSIAEAASQLLAADHPHGCAMLTLVGVADQAVLDGVGLSCDAASPVCAPTAAVRVLLPLRDVPWIADIRTTVADARLTLEETPIHRVMVKVTTCSDATAGTDSVVRLTLGDQTLIVDRPGDDRQPGMTELMEVPLAHGMRGKDVTQLVLRVGGSDEWCVDEVALYLNDSKMAVFEARGRTWLGALTFSAEQLRGDPTRWTIDGPQAAMCELPTVLTASRLSRDILTRLGDAQAGGKTFLSLDELYWSSGDGVSLTRIDHDSLLARIHVHYRWSQKLKYAVTVTVTLTAMCDERGLRFVLSDANASAKPASRAARTLRGIGIVLGPVGVAIVEGVVDRLADKKLSSLPDSVSLGRIPICPAIDIPEGTNDVQLSWPPLPPAPVCLAGLLGV